MLALAIIATVGAFVWMLFVGYANSMRASPGAFEGRGLIIAGWLVAVFFWIGWGSTWL